MLKHHSLHDNQRGKTSSLTSYQHQNDERARRQKTNQKQMGHGDKVGGEIRKESENIRYVGI